MSQCPICLTETCEKETYTTKCNHTFCNICIMVWKKNNISCPLCRAQIQRSDFIPPYDAIYLRDLERIRLVEAYDKQHAQMLYIEYAKWLDGIRYTRPVI